MAEVKSRMSASGRRSLILAAAGALFGRRGYDGVTLEQIAEAAGVTKPIVYRHFDSKQDLYLSLLTKHRDDLPSFTAGAGGGGPQQVRVILDAWLSYAQTNAHGWRMIFRDVGGDAEIAAFRQAVQDRARDVMADFLQQGSVRAIPRDELAARAEIVRGGLAALILWWIDHPDVSKATLLDAATSLFGGIAGPEPSLNVA